MKEIDLEIDAYTEQPSERCSKAFFFSNKLKQLEVVNFIIKTIYIYIYIYEDIIKVGFRSRGCATWLLQIVKILLNF